MTILHALANLAAEGFNYITSASSKSTTDINMADSYSPTYADICVTRAMLKSWGLPTELVLEILDYAQYNPVINFAGTQVRHALAGRKHPAVAAQVCFDADILTQNTIRQLKATKVRKTKVKEVDFTFVSHDQGFTSEGTAGTFNTSSWLEVSILRPSSAAEGLLSSNGEVYHPRWTPDGLKSVVSSHGATLVECPAAAQMGIQGGEGPFAWYLQGNLVCARNLPPYRVVWASDSGLNEGNVGTGSGKGFLEALKEGDKVLIWARAKYSGWECTVRNIELTVHYDFDE